jgi:hypothetical protein
VRSATSTRATRAHCLVYPAAGAPYWLDLATGIRSPAPSTAALAEVMTAVPALGPDGDRLAYTRTPRDVVMRDLASGREEVFPIDPPLRNDERVISLAWWGERLLVYTQHLGERPSHRMLSIDGAAPARELLPPSPHWVAIHPSPDGRTVAIDTIETGQMYDYYPFVTR